MDTRTSNNKPESCVSIGTDRGQRTGCTCILPKYRKLCVDIARNTMSRVTLFIGTLDTPMNKGNRVSPNVDDVDLRLYLVSGDACGSCNVTSHVSTGSKLQKRTKWDKLPVNYECGHTSAMLLHQPLQTMAPTTNAEEFTSDAPTFQYTITATQTPSKCTMEEAYNKSARTLDMHPLCCARPTLLMNEEKSSVNEVSNKDQASAEPYGCASSSEITTTVQLLCPENLSMIDDNFQTIIPEPVPNNKYHLPMLSDLRDINLLSKESIQPCGSSNRSKQIPSECTMEQTQGRNTQSLPMDKGKRKICDDSNKDQPFPETCGLASFSETSSSMQLLCSEDFSMIGDNRQPIMPNNLTHSGQHLNFLPNSRGTSPSSNETTMHLSSTGRRRRGRPRKRSTISIEGSPNTGNLMHDTHHLCQPSSSSNESPQVQPTPTTAANLNPAKGYPRHHQQGTMHPSSTRSQRRGNLRNRGPAPRQGPPTIYVHMGRCDQICHHCKAHFWQHELPAGDSIGAIVFEGGPDVETDFDVVIEQHDRHLKRVNKLNASYMSLQFALIFLFGEDGYHLGRVLLSSGSSDDPSKKMTMLKYYSYELQTDPTL
ncbi:hypothetical protein CTI12_AA233810 [Artemisia annua]|uniref:Helitron helicase-like domain-containing protein n=1 Tax=Artemisia annua TaxID=35608 RepID=A0A2U1NSQ6_ARTAN|nr:hypothetical protein CTI12_AA233810 [Artemisia annua]